MGEWVDEPIHEPYGVPEVHCGECTHFIPDSINPAAGIGVCRVENSAISRLQYCTCEMKEGVLQLSYSGISPRPFTTIQCEDYEAKAEKEAI